MTKGRRNAVFLAVLIILLFYPNTRVQASGLKKAEGQVDIELKEYMLDENGKEVLWKDIAWAMPGQRISKIPRITNLASKCQVRAKIEMHMGQEVEIPVTEEMLEGMPPEWSYNSDGYYYYSGELDTGESTDLFQAFTIPSVWNTRYGEDGEIQKYYTENNIEITVTVEATGEKNWNGEKISVVSPKTGDEKKIVLLAVAFLTAVCILVFLELWENRRRKKQE